VSRNVGILLPNRRAVSLRRRRYADSRHYQIRDFGGPTTEGVRSHQFVACSRPREPRVAQPGGVNHGGRVAPGRRRGLGQRFDSHHNCRDQPTRFDRLTALRSEAHAVQIRAAFRRNGEKIFFPALRRRGSPHRDAGGEAVHRRRIAFSGVCDRPFRVPDRRHGSDDATRFSRRSGRGHEPGDFGTAPVTEFRVDVIVGG